jgi:hypothetical protein
MMPMPADWLSPSKDRPRTECRAFFSRIMFTAAPALMVAPAAVSTWGTDCWT